MMLLTFCTHKFFYVIILAKFGFEDVFPVPEETDEQKAAKNMLANHNGTPCKIPKKLKLGTTLGMKPFPVTPVNGRLPKSMKKLNSQHHFNLYLVTLSFEFLK